jgi:hypothetical protein
MIPRHSKALGFHAVANGLLGIFGHEGFEFALGSFVVEKGAPSVPAERRKLRPGIRCPHIDDADGLDARPRRFSIDETRHFARLHAAPAKGPHFIFLSRWVRGLPYVRKWTTHIVSD